MFGTVPRAVEVGSYQRGLFPSATFFSFLFLSAFPVLGVTSSHAPSSTPSRSTMLESPAGKFLLQSTHGAKGRGSYSESHLWGITFTMDTGPL